MPLLTSFVLPFCSLLSIINRQGLLPRKKQKILKVFAAHKRVGFGACMHIRPVTKENKREQYIKMETVATRSIQLGRGPRALFALVIKTNTALVEKKKYCQPN